MMDSSVEFMELAQQLKQERLFVNSEKLQLQNLNEKVGKTVERLFSLAWITKQQRINLDGLIFSKPESTPSACCQRANVLEDVHFIDCYKRLGIHETEYGEFLQNLRTNPGLISMYLTAGEKLNLAVMHHMVNVFVDSIYGHCILQEDEHLVLQLLKHLMEIQLATNENPRRLLRHGTCAFSRVYKVFNEGLFSAKLFLTGALHEPIMNLLMEDDLFLDIDPGKAAVRFPQNERLRRFGKEGTTQYVTNLQKYRNWTIVKLVNLTKKFVAGIRNNLHCFPTSLLWLVKQLYNLVMKAQKVEVREVGAMCADLVFAFFICPAIVNPEPYGICDAHISYIARFNLMQVAQILQVLAMAKWEEIDPKLMDLYGKFERNCMSSVLDLLLEGGVDNSPPVGPQVPGLIRSAMLIPESDLHSLISFIVNVQNDLSADGCVDKKAMQKILDLLPKSAFNTPPQVNGHSNEPVNGSHTPTLTNRSRTLLSKVGKSKSRFNSSNPEDFNGSPRSNDGEEANCSSNSHIDVEDVLVVTLNVNTEVPGLFSESKVLALEQAKLCKVKLKLDAANVDNSTVSVPTGEMMQEKRTRFSLSHDQDSIGNTSDNFEAISEAASNHSVSSSLELENENENDNLSDMISANVSGRGTPNVSGRDTPSSQIGNDERDGDEPEPPTLNLPVTARKQNREDISDKFGKFEIKNLLEGDETVSLVSDTWSTDVLASDSENVEQGERSQEEIGFRRGGMGTAASIGSNLEIGGSSVVSEGLLANSSFITRNRSSNINIQDVIDTASEAWSTDVLASDSERLQDVDTDDTGSIARSDDTASLYRSDDVPPRIDVVSLPVGTIKGSENGLDICEHGDNSITPRASGGRSPIEGPSTSGACASVSWLNNMHANVGFKPIVDGIERNCQQITGNGNDHVRHLVTDANEFSRLNNNGRKCNGDNGFRHAKSLKFTNGEIDNIIDAFDPLRKGNFSSQRSGNEESFLPLSDDVDGSGIHDDTRNFDSSGFSNSLLNGPEMSTPSLVYSSELAERMADFSQYNNVSNNQFLSDESSQLIVETDITGFQVNVKDEQEFERINDDVGSVYSEISEVEGISYSGNSLQSSAKDMPYEFRTEKQMNSDFISRNSLLLDSAAGCSSNNTIKKARPSTSSSLASSSSSNSSLPGEMANLRVNGLDNRVEINTTDATVDVGSTLVPTASSGAIPKSISFDKTAEKGDKDSNDSEDSKNKKGFFKNFKISLKRPSRRTNRYQEDKIVNHHKEDSYNSVKFNSDGVKIAEETSDDILAKYRQKTTYQPSNSTNSDKSLPVSPPVVDDNEDESLANCEDNFEDSYAFADAKRKLRLVLSTADIQAVPWLESSVAYRMESPNKLDNRLIGFLKMQLAEAINLQDRSLTAQLHETLRCVGHFDKAGCVKLFSSLKEDYNSRHPYIAYLIQCRQSYLAALSHLERLMKRVERDKAVCSKYLISVCVRLFLEKVERLVQRFMEEFQNLTVSDEKTDFLEQFLQYLYKQMETDPIWRGASPLQLEQANGAIERSIMGKLYINALYPNGDADIHRDQVLTEHIQKLSHIITTNHKDLRIPKMYHYECPWPSAQAEIITINAYKTPADKLQCVVRCCTTIMNLLSMANQKSVPAADDFIPVLVYIVIKANPGGLLSTIQYVNSFYEKQLKGEDEYWWTQFCSAVEFIKTMDYGIR
ncbi:hypothetical protein CHUAL_006124 [Chamberlinius hualienensis]